MKNWLDVVDALYEGSWSEDLRRFRSPFAFRGLSRENHTLSSSLVRLADGREDVRRVELALLRNFRKYAHEEARATDSIWDWLALGQHRGLPTRLLDWTYSPLVALHFATEDPATFKQDGVVWCVNFVEANKRLPRRLKRILGQEGSDTFTVEMLSAFTSLRDFDALSREPFVVFLEPPAIDRRILNQLALFSLMSSPTATLDVWVREHPDLCRRVVVPSAMKWEIRDKLDQANVNERVLFPGLDGLSRWLARYYMPTAANPDAALPRLRPEGPDIPADPQLRTAPGAKRRRTATRRRKPAK
ncbi:MAG: FRG domain-containing protein [Burkholderiaceae bacterium]